MIDHIEICFEGCWLPASMNDLFMGCLYRMYDEHGQLIADPQGHVVHRHGGASASFAAPIAD